MKTKQKLKLGRIVLIVAVLILLAVLGGSAAIDAIHNKNSNSEVSTINTLEKIVDVSELSTFTAVYNGVAEVYNEKDPEKIDYYVSYEAKLNAGIDFKEIKIEMDNDALKIMATLPPVVFIDTDVDITSMDFIFCNKKADKIAVTEEAYRACSDDVSKERANQDSILELAEQNAQNIVRALMLPYIENFLPGYQLIVE